MNSDTVFLARPEWRYLKYWKPSMAIVGILVIPGNLGLLQVGLPFFRAGPVPVEAADQRGDVRTGVSGIGLFRAAKPARR